MFTSTGTLRYSPKKEASDQNWWLILDCDPVIGQYYRHLYQKHHFQCRKLASPFWGPHITILRNEEPADKFKHLWNAHAGEIIKFDYSGEIHSNYSPERYRSFWWLNTFCERFAEIRQQLGLLPVEKAWEGDTNFHLTIGSWENPERKDWFFNEFRDGE